VQSNNDSKGDASATDSQEKSISINLTNDENDADGSEDSEDDVQVLQSRKHHKF